MYARILAVANAYHAITSDRPHQPARSSEAALVEIEQYQGKQFDPIVVRALRDILGAELTVRAS